MTEPALTVVICTHNPRADYLGRALEALHGQTVAADRWELVVVDNRSTEPLEGRIDLSWCPNARIIREETLGLTPARLRGIAEANGEVLVFVDDDNVLDPDYLDETLRIAAERPWLGAWSGQCRGEFEAPPAEWTRRYWGNLVIREFDKDVWSNLPRLSETMPCGAGMVVRRSVARHYLALNEVGGRSIQFDRTGDSLLSGGDNDLAGCSCAIGLGVGLTPSLKLRHLISSGRFEQQYLQRLIYGIHFSSVLLDAEYGILPRKRPVLGRLLDVFRVLRHRGLHRKMFVAAIRGRNDAECVIANRPART